MLKDDRGQVASAMISIMVGVVVFVVAIMAISPIIDVSCEYQAVVNETFNSSAQDVYVQLGNTSLVGSVVVTNTTGTTTYTVTTDYVMNNTDGKILSVSTGSMNNYTEYYISYNYMDASYIDSAITRTIVRLLPLLLAVAVMVAIVSVVGKET